MAVKPDLAATLAGLSVITDICRDDWWIISGAAAALYAAVDIPTNDLDLLVSPDDAARLSEHFVLPNRADGRHPKFRSDFLLRYDWLALPVEIMAGFEAHDGADWHLVEPRTRIAIPQANQIIYVPGRAELTEMLRLFGRPKDAERIAYLSD
ncbi:MAG: hypothetical protein KAZ17_01725 [Sphingorhabdus sp.]|nr:hypothetical protein [Sphingorhabdus sp.]